MKIGFIGTGVITEAIVKGLLKARFPAAGFVVSPRSESVAAKLAASSPLVHVGKDNQDVVDRADVVFLAVRPQVAEEVLRPLRFAGDKIVGSLIATVPIPTLQDWIGIDLDISRSIPLPMVADLNGVTAVYPATAGTVLDIMSAIGAVIPCETIEEFDACAIAASLMGLYFGIAETCTVRLGDAGMPYPKARAYLAHLFHGLADTAVKAPGTSFEDLRIGHTTAGGLNDQLFEHFRTAGGIPALSEALDIVAARIRGTRD